MKFMKLGSRPDTFYTIEAVRSISSEVSSDLIVQVKGTRYMLHKFPLLSKCLRLQRLCSESPESSHIKIVQLPDFPGGIDTFELCSKFCYGITITISPYNIVAARCAAEYLQMTEDVESGNLINKLEAFLNSCILKGWKDSIVTLQSTKLYPVWSEDLGITSRCIKAITSKVLTHPSKVSLSQSKGWWAEDIAELSLDLYWRTMIAIKATGKVPSNLIGDALKAYAAKWLPITSRETDGSDSDSASEITSKHRLVLESIVSLLPTERGAVSCSFLLKLLKASNFLNASMSTKMELARRVGLQLEEANVTDLLIPSVPTLYDVDIVMIILEQFMLQSQSPPTSPPRSKMGIDMRRRPRSAENIDYEFQGSRRSSSASHSSKLKVAKLVDGYLKEIAQDPNLSMSKFITIAETVPDFSRAHHDDLYRAIDIYLKAHPDLNKSERKRLCRVLDCQKLSMEACMHAAQNELLPLRVVVKVLFFEQARAGLANGKVTEIPSNLKALLAAHKDPRPSGDLCSKSEVPADDQWNISELRSPESLEKSRLHHEGIKKCTKLGSLCALPSKPKRMFSKFWSSNRSANERK